MCIKEIFRSFVREVLETETKEDPLTYQGKEVGFKSFVTEILENETKTKATKTMVEPLQVSLFL